MTANKKGAGQGAHLTTHAADGSTDTNRAAIFRKILVDIPGLESLDQRRRIMAALERLGSVSTFEMMRQLDCFDPRPRIHELRHNEGWDILTLRTNVVTESGELHRRIGLYVLIGKLQKPEQFALTGMSDKQKED